jgi:hypothetical protein
MSKQGKCVPYHPWLISKLRSPILSARYLMAAAEDSREAFLHALRNINEAFPLPVEGSGQTNAACEAGNTEASKDAPSHKSPAQISAREDAGRE